MKSGVTSRNWEIQQSRRCIETRIWYLICGFAVQLILTALLSITFVEHRSITNKFLSVKSSKLQRNHLILFVATPIEKDQCSVGLRCGQNHLLNYKQKKPLSGNYVYFVSKAQRVNKLSSRRAHVGGDNSSLHICFKILGTIAFCLYLDRETCAL